jgi:sugar (pentulose or hexulose) kinase
MCEELYGLYDAFGEARSHVVASGGGVKRNAILQRILADRFGMTVSLLDMEEEAAVGAALFSALAAGKLSYGDGFAEFIRYR